MARTLYVRHKQFADMWFVEGRTADFSRHRLKRRAIEEARKIRRNNADYDRIVVETKDGAQQNVIGG